VLATLTGITTVGDYRVADMAVGGEGAPLVPYFDWLAFRSSMKNRILLNIGGIANMTVLPKNCSTADVIAFDTGPGNMVVDALMQTFFGKSFDKNGRVAARGTIVLELFDWMKKHPYVKRQPPKSTGREAFGNQFVEELLARATHYDREDVVATASHFTAYSIHNAYKRFIGKNMRVDELIISGGGAKNAYFVEALRNYFTSCPIRFTDEFGVPSEAKEAMCFAILANETVAGNPTNLPRVTGAKRKVVLGTTCRCTPPTKVVCL
jgi:anhydro-N-acetylmuramic acid kinase